MSKKKQPINKHSSARVGNISDVSGNINVAGGNITLQTTSGLSAVDVEQLFDQLYAAIEVRPGTSPAAEEDLKADIGEVQAALTQAVVKNVMVDEDFLCRRFRSIARMAPDILDVVVATLANPLAGLGVAFKKIAEKAKGEV
jgi:hypothetical protein